MYHSSYQNQLMTQTAYMHLRTQIPVLLQMMDEYRHLQMIRDTIHTDGMNRSMVKMVNHLIPKIVTPSCESFNHLPIPARDDRVHAVVESLDQAYTTRSDALKTLRQQLSTTMVSLSTAVMEVAGQYRAQLTLTPYKTMEDYQNKIALHELECTLPDGLHAEHLIDTITQLRSALDDLQVPNLEGWTDQQVGEAIHAIETVSQDLAPLTGYTVQMGSQVIPTEVVLKDVSYEPAAHIGYGDQLVALYTASQGLVQSLDAFLDQGYTTAFTSLMAEEDPEFEEDHILPEPNDDVEQGDHVPEMPEEDGAVTAPEDPVEDDADPSIDEDDMDPEDVDPEEDIATTGDEDTPVYTVNRLQAVALHALHTAAVLTTATQTLGQVMFVMDTLASPQDTRGY